MQVSRSNFLQDVSYADKITFTALSAFPTDKILLQCGLTSWVHNRLLRVVCWSQLCTLCGVLFIRFISIFGARGDAVRWGIVLQAGRSRVRFPMVSLEFFIDTILPAALWPWGRLSLQQKWVPGIFPGGERRPVRRADNFTTFVYRLSWNLGASASWKPQNLIYSNFIYL